MFRINPAYLRDPAQLEKAITELVRETKALNDEIAIRKDALHTLPEELRTAREELKQAKEDIRKHTLEERGLLQKIRVAQSELMKLERAERKISDSLNTLKRNQKSL